MTSGRTTSTEAQAAASRANGAKSLGPTSDIGKAASCANGIVHGLAAAEAVLMPDETLAMFEDELRGWYGTVPAPTPGARKAVARLAGISFRQRRLDRLEARIVNANLDRLVADSPPAKARKVAQDALDGVRGLAAMCESVDSPRHVHAVASIRPAIKRVAELVDEADVPVGVSAVLDRAFARLSHEDHVVEVPAAAFHELAAAARAAETALLDRLADVGKALDAERERVADQALLGDEKQAKVLDRHRARLAREMMAQVSILKALREITAPAEIEVGSGSPVPFVVQVKDLGAKGR